MRDIIKNLDEITDSRELLESKPHPFTSIFIYILIAILFSGFLWACFSEKEILVKATGVIQTEQNTYKIAPLVSGKVESINYISGKIVNKGDVLLTINHDELDFQKESFIKSIADLEKNLSNLNKFKKSVNDGKNYFDEKSEIEKDYYEKYLSYELNLEQSEDQLNQYKSQKYEYEEKISNLELMVKSVNDNKNYFKEESIYYNQYVDYKYNLNKYNDLIQKAQWNYDTLKKPYEATAQVTALKAKFERLTI